ncbi:MAG: TolC family protein [Chitinophagaceae bacterium]
MKKFFSLHHLILITSVLLISSAAFSQGHFTTSNPSVSIPQRGDSSTAIEERLVQLALNKPSYQASESQVKISQYELTKARNSWLDLLTISTNYNDQTFAPKSTGSTQQNYIYPKYFFGVTIPVGLIFTRGSDINIAKNNVDIKKNDQEELARTIRADVVSKYKQYKSYGQLLALQNQVIDDEQAAFLQTEQKFKDGSVTVEVFNAASKSYNTEMANRINLQLQQDLIKLDIERMIGMKLENVLKQ